MMEDIGAKFSQYDVLVEPPIPGVSTEYSLTKHEGHVGNKRFQILLNMKQGSYGDAQRRGDVDECNRTVDNLVDTVCNQVVPPGRFLESKSVVVGNGMPVLQWHAMDEAVLKPFLHKVLQPTDKIDSASNEGNQAESLVAAAASIRFSLENNELSDLDNPAFPPSPAPCRNDDGQKRRRRSSLLRRSNSESMVGMVLDNRKKLNFNVSDLRGGTQEEPTFWKSASSIDQLNRMDVVLTPARDALDPSCTSVGNNRLHILLAVRSGQFKGGSIDAQEKLLDELIETVYIFWKGRFLVEDSGGYEELPKGEAREAMRTIMGGRAPGHAWDFAGTGRRQRHSDPVGGVSSLGMSNNATAGSGFMGPSVTRTSWPNPHQVFAATLPSTLMENAQKNQNRALMGLKKQQARNQNANRIKEKLGVAQNTPSNSQSGNGVPLFPIGGMVQPSTTGSAQRANNSFTATNRMAASRTSFNPRRESTVFSKVDATVMEQLVASLDDADCNDDMDEPLPPSNFNSFGNQFNPGTLGSQQHPNIGERNEFNGFNSSDGRNGFM